MNAKFCWKEECGKALQRLHEVLLLSLVLHFAELSKNVAELIP